MRDTLILNLDGMPLSIVPISALNWQESVTLEWLDRVDVLDSYDDWIVRSPSIEMNVPSVMMLHKYVKVARVIKFSRFNVFLRDEFRCQYCGWNGADKPFELTLDHVIPRHHGGTTRWDNVVASCQDCNLRKSHYLKKPNILPYHPNYWDMVGKRKKHPIVVPHKSWFKWLGWDENLIALKPPKTI